MHMKLIKQSSLLYLMERAWKAWISQKGNEPWSEVCALQDFVGKPGDCYSSVQNIWLSNISNNMYKSWIVINVTQLL